MYAILIGVAAMAAVLSWPVNRWVMRSGGRAPVYGFWLSATAAAVTGVLALAYHQFPIRPVVWGVGAAIGIAFVTGYCLVVMHCLRIGPAGPTVVLYNMGMMWPVALGPLWIDPHPLSSGVRLGLGLSCLSLTAFGFSRPEGAASSEGRHPAASARWLLWAILGWTISGVSQTGQFLGSLLAPRGALAITFAFSLVAALILAPIALRQKGSPSIRKWGSRCEIAGGAISGGCLVIGVASTLTALQRFGPEIVFPFTVTAPMILIPILGQWIYRERLDRIGWAACGLGVGGLLLLTAG